MNIFDPADNLLLVTLLLAAMLAATGVLSYRLYRINQTAREDLNRLTAQLDVFTQTSIEVARTVERLSVAPVGPQGRSGPQNSVSSRRWLLDEAQQRLEEGDELGQIGRRLGLNHDEVSLLHRVCLQRQLMSV